MDSPAPFRQTPIPDVTEYDVRARFPEHAFRLMPQRGRLFVVAAQFAFALLAVALVPHARAAPATYTGEAPVESQSDEDRIGALKIALGNVIVEQTGDASALSRPDVAAAIAKAERYALQFRYKQNPTGGDGAGPRLILVAEFDSAAVEEMLKRLGLGGDTLGAGTAPIDATPTETTVWIGGIGSAEQYARVVSYLGKNNFVRGVRPLQARGDGMLVKLSLATDLAHFLDAIATERTLRVVNAAPPVDGVDATLALGP